MKKLNNLERFTNILPYSSELFGVYQPLLGWKSKRIMGRFKSGLKADFNNFRKSAFGTIKGEIEFTKNPDPDFPDIYNVSKVGIGRLKANQSNRESFLIDALAKQLPEKETDFVDALEQMLEPTNLKSLLINIVGKEFEEAYKLSVKNIEEKTELHKSVANQANKESRIAGYLLELKAKNDTAGLKKVFYGKSLRHLADLYSDPFETIDPKSQIDRVVVSPFSVVHLFRQYFFEFDSFLGTPVEHVWLSPGSEVELIETSSRKKSVERSYETEFETTTTITEESEELDELSESVKTDNQSNTKFGFTGSVEQSWVGGKAKATASLNLENTQKEARETTHKLMRKQSKKLSSKIRKNYKSSFKTITETLDTSSKRYLLRNDTDELINYELRRKMRQIGVQVQDVGTYLCWQTYVDNPGKQLGVSQLVHIAKPSDLVSTPNPEAIAYPSKETTELPIDIPFKAKTSDTTEDDMDESYHHGVEVDTDVAEGSPEEIDADFKGITMICSKPGYKFESIVIDTQGNDIEIRVDDLVAEAEGQGKHTSKVTFSVHLTHVNFHNQPSLRILAKVTWVPTDEVLTKIDAENSDNLNKHQEEKRRAFEEAYLKAARERVKLASHIKSRKFEELREEERIVIYRALVQDMLTNNIPLKDNRSRHAVAELLNSIFDIDKMLYFVAPEWWRPRLHRSSQTFGELKPKQSFTAVPDSNSKSLYYKMNKAVYENKFSVQNKSYVPEESVVGWGGLKEHGRDNYYITEDSKPAKFGSSLGWLMQLDGDNLRNTFLNSPWVKAMIPIRPGKEKAAFNWLQQVNVEGSDGLDSEYIASPQELAEIPHSGSKVTLMDAINHLCLKVKEKHDASIQTDKFPIDEINADNKVSATPIDKVYEHGFYPNQDGFKLDVGGPFEVFDQWTEVLPTDQIVPVEVKYDPITGRQIDITNQV